MEYKLKLIGIGICLMITVFNGTVLYKFIVPEKIRIGLEQMRDSYYDPEKENGYYIVRVENIFETSIHSTEGPVFFIQHDKGISLLESDDEDLFEKMLRQPKESRYLFVETVPAFTMGYLGLKANITSNLRAAITREFESIKSNLNLKDSENPLIIQQYLTTKRSWSIDELIWSIGPMMVAFYWMIRLRKTKGKTS